MDGLDPRHKGSQPRVADAAVQARIARKNTATAACRWKLSLVVPQGDGASVGTEQVHRAARGQAQMRLKPHRLDGYMASGRRPDFEKKAADIIGLYMNPPQHAAVFCVDEKTAIQALDRLDPVLPAFTGTRRKARL